jgi:putative NADH-flavin reductase
MKMTVTVSLGYITTPLIKELISKGHSVTVISSNIEKQAAIEILPAIIDVRLYRVRALIKAFIRNTNEQFQPVKNRHYKARALYN